MKRFLITIVSIFFAFNLFAEDSYVLNQTDIKDKNNFSLTVENWTYKEKINISFYTSEDGEIWQEQKTYDIKQTKSVSVISVSNVSMDSKISYQKFNIQYYKISVNGIENVEFLLKNKNGLCKLLIRNKVDTEMEIPSIKTEGTICINKAELEKHSNLWIYDDIRLLNKDDAHVKTSVEYKTYCNKGNKWVYLGYLEADYDSRGEISVDDPIALINSTYIAFVPVNYKKENVDIGVYSIRSFVWTESSVSSYNYSTPTGKFSFQIKDNDLIIDFSSDDYDSI